MKLEGATRKRVVIVGVVVAIAAAAIVAWLVFRHRPDPNVLVLYGNVDIREVDVGFRVGGRIVEATVDEGDRVEAGQKLARLDEQPYREAWTTADRAVQRTAARYEELLAGSRPEEIKMARARVSETQAAFVNAEAGLRRQRQLTPGVATTQEEIDAAQAERDARAAEVLSARNALALSVEGPRAEQIAAARAEHDTAVAQREQAATSLADTVVNSPSAATVLTRIREPGTVVAAGEPVYTLSLRNPIYVRAYVTEPDLGKLRPGSLVSVTTDSSRRVYRLRIVVSDADEGLRQGMPVTVRIVVGPTGGGHGARRR